MRQVSCRVLPLFALIALSSSACGTTYVQVKRRAPAEVNIPSGVPMAVGQIGGEGGEALASELTAALLATRRFEVLERQNISAAMAELRFSSEGFVSDDSAISFGEMTGAATLVVGDVQAAEYGESDAEQATECPSGGKLVPCVRYTQTARARVRVVLNVVETKTGRLLAAKPIEANRERVAESFDGPPGEIGVREPLLSECRSEVVERFARVVAPHDVTEQVALRTDDDLPELEVGTNYAILGQWGDAVAQFRAAVKRASAPPFTPEQHAATLYDLGVALGFSGAFDEGIAEIERAFVLDPDPMYREQIDTLRRYRDEAARLAAQEPAAK